MDVGATGIPTKAQLIDVYKTIISCLLFTNSFHEQIQIWIEFCLKGYD